MYKKFFTAFDDIAAPKHIVEKTVRNIRDADQSEKVINMKTKRKILKPIGAVAAALAIAVALGVMIIPSAPDQTNSRNRFFLTANAAEKPSVIGDSFTTAGTMDESSGGSSITKGIPDDISAGFSVNIRCDGENIESLTYKISTSEDLAAIALPGDAEIIDQKGKSPTLGTEKGFKSWETGEDEKPYFYYDEVKTSFAKQLDGAKINVRKRISGDDSMTAKKYLDIEDDAHWVSSTDKSEFEKINNDYTELLLRGLRLEITAEFKDGSTQTQTVAFSADCQAKIGNYTNGNTGESGKVYYCIHSVKVKTE